MKNLTIFSVLLIFSTLALLLMNAPSTSGRAFRIDKLPDKGKNWSCATCHLKNLRP